MVKYKPQRNIEYTLVIPETGKIITIRFLDVSEKNRLIFLNTENNNTLDFHPSRFSFLYAKCKIKETKLKEPILLLSNIGIKNYPKLEEMHEKLRRYLANIENFMKTATKNNLGELYDDFLEDAKVCKSLLEQAIENPSLDITATEKYNCIIRDLKFVLQEFNMTKEPFERILQSK